MKEKQVLLSLLFLKLFQEVPQIRAKLYDYLGSCNSGALSAVIKSLTPANCSYVLSVYYLEINRYLQKLSLLKQLLEHLKELLNACFLTLKTKLSKVVLQQMPKNCPCFSVESRIKYNVFLNLFTKKGI